MNKKIINMIMVGGITASLIMVILTFTNILIYGKSIAFESISWILYTEITIGVIILFWWFKHLYYITKDRKMVIEL